MPKLLLDPYDGPRMRAWDEERDKHVKIFLNALEEEFPNEDPLFMDFRPYGYVPPLPTKDYTLDPHVYFGCSKFTPPTVELTFHDLIISVCKQTHLAN